MPMFSVALLCVHVVHSCVALLCIRVMHSCVALLCIHVLHSSNSTQLLATSPATPQRMLGHATQIPHPLPVLDVALLTFKWL